MPLPASGTITLNQVNVELGKSGTASISMNDSDVRSVFAKPGSGVQISMSDGYGKKAYSGTITYSLGNGGTGGVGAANGSSGFASTLSYAGINLTANGGGQGLYNSSTNSSGGTASGGAVNNTGGTGSGASGDVGGGGGGGINAGNAIPNPNGSSWGGNGANAIDFQGLSSALSGTGYTLGIGANGSSPGSIGTANATRRTSVSAYS